MSQMREVGDRKKLEKLLRVFYKEVFTLKDETNAFNIHPIFNTLPSKKDYPDYYAVIRTPVSLNTLKKRVPHYTKPQEFLNDIVQIGWNAITYNTKGSVIYQYATVLNKYVKEQMYPRLRKEYPFVRYPYLGKLPDEADEKEQLAFVEKERLEDEKNGIVSTKTELNQKENTVVEETDQDDEEYLEFKKPTMRLRTNRKISSYQESHSPSYNPISSPQISSKAVQHKAHVRRGRPPTIDLPYLQRIKNILKNFKREYDQDTGDLLTASVEKLPPDMSNVVPNPVSMDDIRKKTKTRKYKDFSSFQNEFNLMLTNFKLYYRSDLDELKIINKLEKVFNIFVRNELSRPDEFYVPEGDLRYPLDSIVACGLSFKIGDWVLLNNPNDAKKPIVGQVFKLWKTSDGGQWLNACWYFRPEQTVHRVDRLFYKNEVMKTGQYRDHPIEDIVGKCYVIHFTRFQRGDPDINLEGPLFVCEFRYNENDKVFNKIRTWKACLPEELRYVDEQTIPVPGRKFFKYPSPIRHLLPSNASVDDRLPEPTKGAPNAPPLVGAVYVRPMLDRDDLGEYMTSTDCPRYIIRPGDPPEEGKIDYESGTVVTNYATTNALPRTNNHSTVRLPSLRQSRTSTAMNSGRNTPDQGYPLLSTNNYGDTPGGLTVQRLTQLQFQRLQQKQQQEQQKKLQANNNYRLTNVVSNLNAQASRSSMFQVVVDSPSSYILPISITKNVDVLQRSDYGSQSRRSHEHGSVSDQILTRKRIKKEVLWFKGASISIEENLLNLGSEYFDVPLNKWFQNTKKRKLEFEEIEEVLETPSQKNESNNFEGDDNISHKDNDLHLDHEHDNEKNYIPGTFVLGLRPSAKFMAHKLKPTSI
ncbi:hypothetical protein KAFR_0F03990 [Kazachstania africana CBS 2517]|uniref:BAH domain-containing protein n=1 Tax=Kazachstania africana (strain ATCC 22294 / BCRC 22015 / CBS 2517 / CECT 1963 / NBRC 1671 / NRRL Y-8276) TaxID=1071382 RepID=H2AX94_KAZAF|nr:hypothetical protein KAFR_0F03990 [Kazachstania africana CBS 2517]CCF58994.1 hypothetical protein KAFR_0F03990 [Kazachstania africana CBS 2517]